VTLRAKKCSALLDVTLIPFGQQVAPLAPLLHARRQGLKCVRIPLHETDCDVLIRMGLLKEDQRHDHKALEKALLGLLYRAGQDLP
jgi:hypothetical protein